MSFRALPFGLAVALATAFVVVTPAVADAQEPAACLSPNPADWPQPSKPYFMLVADTSGSMTACTTPPTTYPSTCDPTAAGFALNSCGYVPTRYNDAKCALQQTVLAFSGQVNFGLSTFAVTLNNCPNNCGSQCSTCSTSPPPPQCCELDAYGCAVNCFAEEFNTTNQCAGCGPRPGNAATRAGAIIRVPMLQDHFWMNPPAPTNVADLLSWMDASCAGDHELFAGGATPLNGALRDMKRYFETGWTAPDGSVSYPTPLASNDLPGEGVNGGTACRSVNVILLTDGDESCDTQADAVAAAQDLYANGVTVGGKTFKVRTHVINFAGGSQANTDAIAAAGGTTASLFATNAVQLAQALANIVAGAIQPEVCDNGDNNCNGCTDEGYKHYCNIGQTCCSWATAAQRNTCLASYEASVAANPPDGDTTLLPCITASQQQQPSEWLCYNPLDICDEADNNCQDGIDEGQVKCGNPLSCPSAEVCDGQDNDCNGQVDDGVCGGCVPVPEVCDGCDNDCDGIADNPPPGGFQPLPCGLPNPANCNGIASCQAPQPVAVGTCAAGAGYGQCTNNPQPEVCDGIDNNCNQVVDEGYVSAQCEPPNNPPNLVYGGTSQCTYGATACVGGAVVCQGGTGPGVEICDGIDNDCDGVVDNNVFGVNQPCGVNTPPCTPGMTACVNGALICQGGTQPQPEMCDGVDNDCDGEVDEAPLTDAPQPGQGGCWNLPGNCCSHQNFNWCPPTGGTCYANGTLSAPCSFGTLTCDGSSGWICIGDTTPQPEVCDGIDNDCNGAADDGTLPNVGGVCGSAVGECTPGTLACVQGTLDCVGDTPPTPELCDNLDNDCNGLTDDGIPAGGACTMSYDTTLYPGDRSHAPCQDGVLECDGMGTWVCTGGVGPQPEVCDGIDNDCDNNVDEAGAQPDGIDGSANPFPPPAANIGEVCGVMQGACEPGNYACLNGLFACIGGVGPIFEECNCADDDCDGLSDEPPGPNDPPLCNPGTDCVNAGEFCQCAEPCASGEYPCPPGQVCTTVTLNGGQQAQYCVTDFKQLCGDCSKKTAMDGNSNVVCAPAGTDAPGCHNTPECVCKGQPGCREPCFNVDCPSGKVCSNFGPTPGECVDNTCYQTGCSGCNKACHGGLCVDNPCGTGSCPQGKVCKPSADFSTFICVDSCFGVSCPSGQKCNDGQCGPTCDPACAAGQVCNEATQMCVPNVCTDSSCPDGSTCDPVTGACGDDPCEGVLCPDGQTCTDGNCGAAGAGGAGGASGAGGAGGASTGSGATSGSGGAGGESGVFKMPSGGSGCACDVAGRSGERRRQHLGWLALLGMLTVVARRRRRGGAAEGSDEVQS